MIIKEIANRRSVREYKPDEVSEKQILELIKAAQFAPAAIDSQSTEFMVIKDQTIKNRIHEILKSQHEYIKKAPILIIPIIDTKKSLFSIQGLSAASENIFLQAANLGLGTVWKNIRPEIASTIKILLDIPDNFALINIIPVGYPAAAIQPHTDEDFNQKKIHYEKWQSAK
jgi:nitroreductase